MKAAETKKHQVERIEVHLSNIASLEDQSLVSISQGTGFAQRIGHDVSSVGLSIQGQVFNNDFNLQTIVRLMVIRIKNNQAVPAQDLLENDTNNQPVAPDDVRSLYRRINGDAYDVLASKYLTLHGGAASVNMRVFKFWIPFRRKMEYDAPGTSEPTSNRIHLVAFARTGKNDNAHPNVELSYCSTFYYKDV